MCRCSHLSVQLLRKPPPIALISDATVSVTVDNDNDNDIPLQSGIYFNLHMASLDRLLSRWKSVTTNTIGAGPNGTVTVAAESKVRALADMYRSALDGRRDGFKKLQQQLQNWWGNTELFGVSTPHYMNPSSGAGPVGAGVDNYHSISIIGKLYDTCQHLLDTAPMEPAIALDSLSMLHELSNSWSFHPKGDGVSTRNCAHTHYAHKKTAYWDIANVIYSACESAGTKYATIQMAYPRHTGTAIKPTAVGLGTSIYGCDPESVNPVVVVPRSMVEDDTPTVIIDPVVAAALTMVETLPPALLSVPAQLPNAVKFRLVVAAIIDILANGADTCELYQSDIPVSELDTQRQLQRYCLAMSLFDICCFKADNKLLSIQKGSRIAINTAKSSTGTGINRGKSLRSKAPPIIWDECKVYSGLIQPIMSICWELFEDIYIPEIGGDSIDNK